MIPGPGPMKLSACLSVCVCAPGQKNAADPLEREGAPCNYFLIMRGVREVNKLTQNEERKRMKRCLLAKKNNIEMSVVDSLEHIEDFASSFRNLFTLGENLLNS